MAENQLPDIEYLQQRKVELETQRIYEVKCADAAQSINPSTLLNKDFTPTGDGSESNSAPTQSSPDYPSDR